MFWFGIIILTAVVCKGVIGVAVGLRLLRFGEDVVKQSRTVRTVLISIVDILAGGIMLAAVATKVVDPLVALILSFFILLAASIQLRNVGGSEQESGH